MTINGTVRAKINKTSATAAFGSMSSLSLATNSDNERMSGIRFHFTQKQHRPGLRSLQPRGRASIAIVLMNIIWKTIKQVLSKSDHQACDPITRKCNYDKCRK